MEVIRADVLGMCFGVRDAIDATRRVESPRDVSIHGEIVHNPSVLDELARRGFHQSGEDRRDLLPSAPTILVTAHGVSQRERARLTASGKRLIDTTCPLVRRAHEAACELDRAGYHIVVIGRADHVEVRGLTEDLERYVVVRSADEARDLGAPRIGVIAQTTTTEETARAVLAALEDRNPGAEVRWIDTICQPTKDRQQALDQLVDRVDAVVVVGGSNSNNTNQLAERCRARGVPAYRVSGAAEVEAGWFSSCRRVGLTAGTSTLDHTVDEVEARIAALPSA